MYYICVKKSNIANFRYKYSFDGKERWLERHHNIESPESKKSENILYFFLSGDRNIYTTNKKV